MVCFIELFFLIAGIFLFWISGVRRKRLGLPEGRVLYADTGTRRDILEPLFADDLGLVGKPDYLVEAREGLIPVEIKSGRTPNQPFDSHIYQLAAYCLLVTRNFRKRPPYGIIRYPQRTFAIDFTKELEEELIELVAEMRDGLAIPEFHRSHDQAGRCISCGFGQLCEEKL